MKLTGMPPMMSASRWRSGRRLVLTGIVGTATAAACVIGATAAASAATARTQRSFGAAARSVTAAAAENLATLPAGQTGSRSQVPWPLVGPGWFLAEYTTGSYKKARPVTLYLLDPAGGRYELYHWAATTSPWQIADWSGDKSRVLLEQPGETSTVRQLALATGTITTVHLSSRPQYVLGYTRPDGTNLLVSKNGIDRVSLSGTLQARLISGDGYSAAISAPNGTTEVVNGPAGLELISNAGGIVRRLRVPGATAKLGGCTPVRWWNSTTAVATCISNTDIGAPRVWLVPVSGAAPTALTPPRNGHDGDYGDLDAWRFGKTLYVQALGGCGTRYIGRQAASGKVTPVNVKGSSGNNAVVATSGSRMLVQEFAECTPGSSLVWLNPATRAVQDVLMAPATGGGEGVVAVVPYNRNGEQPGMLQ